MMFKKIVNKLFSVRKENKQPLNYSHVNSFSVSYNGEKNLGEIGPIKNYIFDYEALRLRSWQSYVDSEITQIVLNKFALWIVGSGLKLQAEPSKTVLKSEKINLETEDFNNSVEARFSIFCNSKLSDHAKMVTFNEIANTAFVNSIVGGDVLVILRLKDNNVNVQLVDGAHVATPHHSKLINESKERGNIIRDGIEMSHTGEHIAYFVRRRNYNFERIQAKAEGIVMAFLVYGQKMRLDNVRGIPLITSVLETLKKLERYKEATVGSAEERQKIVMQIIHQAFSTGENPLKSTLAKAIDIDAVSDDIPHDVNGQQLADTVAATTNKQVFNMPQGAEMKGLESKNELYFKDFYTINIELICAALGIPPEVALSKYDSNFSASRAALKDWEHTINTNRARFSNQFYKNVYNFWLEVQILQNKVQAPGYLMAKSKGNSMVIESYRMARFTGATIPHIDPVKEVKAVRDKLGELGKNIPLTTVEAATEELNGGESMSNIEQFSKEVKFAESLDIKDSVESEDKEVWTINERRDSDGKEDIEGGDAIYMPSTQIPAIEIEP